MIEEAPAVLGGARYREIEGTYPTALLAANLNALKRQGELDIEDVALLTSIVDAAI